MATLLLICRCHLHATMEQRQTTCSSAVERKIKATVHGNIINNMQLSLTHYNGTERDNVQR